MQFQVRLLKVWIFVVIATLISMIIEFTFMIVTHWQWDPVIYVLFAMPSIYFAIIIAALICSRIHRITIHNEAIVINNSKRIPYDTIDWYIHDQNFFLDGFRLKTKQKKNYFLTVLNFIKKDPNYTNFKDTLLNKLNEKQIQFKKFN